MPEFEEVTLRPLLDPIDSLVNSLKAVKPLAPSTHFTEAIKQVEESRRKVNALIEKSPDDPLLRLASQYHVMQKRELERGRELALRLEALPAAAFEDVKRRLGGS